MHGSTSLNRKSQTVVVQVSLPGGQEIQRKIDLVVSPS